MTTNTVSAVGLLIRTLENISQEAQYYILTLHSENVYRYQTKHEFSPAFADIHICSYTGSHFLSINAHGLVMVHGVSTMSWTSFQIQNIRSCTYARNARKVCMRHDRPRRPGLKRSNMHRAANSHTTCVVLWCSKWFGTLNLSPSGHMA